MKEVDFAALGTYLLALVLTVGTPVWLYATVDDPKQTFPQAGPQEISSLLSAGVEAIQSAVTDRSEVPATNACNAGG